MDAQQLAAKVAQLESRVATLEDEGKIVKGEVKQILTEIRTAILVRDNPFEGDGGLAAAASAPPPIAVAAVAQPAPPPATRPEPAPLPPPAAKSEPAPEPAKEPVMLRPVQPPPAPHTPAWSLLTIAGLTAWAEEAMLRLGSLRLEILLDLCETAGHISPEARTALSRVSEMEIPEPAQAPSSNETVALLRQLDALVNDAETSGTSLRLARL